jgi:hypothetical protein
LIAAGAGTEYTTLDGGVQMGKSCRAFAPIPRVAAQDHANGVADMNVDIAGFSESGTESDDFEWD